MVDVLRILAECLLRRGIVAMLAVGSWCCLSFAQEQPVGDRDAFLQGRTKDCPGCNLAGVQLQRRDLSQADLSRAVLRGATLHGANLSNSKLDGADLQEANLNKTDMRGAS